jgi:hypothetical protein
VLSNISDLACYRSRRVQADMVLIELAQSNTSWLVLLHIGENTRSAWQAEAVNQARRTVEVNHFQEMPFRHVSCSNGRVRLRCGCHGYCRSATRQHDALHSIREGYTCCVQS